MPEETTNNPATTPATEPIHFEQCLTCGNPLKHGYLQKGEGEMPIPLSSIDAAKYLLGKLREIGETIEVAEEERILAEMRAVGILDSHGEETDLTYHGAIDGKLLEMAMAQMDIRVLG